MEYKLDIRPVTEADVGHMLEIYTPYVLSSGVSFETSLPTIEEFWKRI